MKLIIENFQALEGKTELEFNPGVNLVVGPTNNGKTAIFRSLIGLVQNYKGSVEKYITHHKDHLEVSAQFDQTTVYGWYKDLKKNTEYRITDLDSGKTQPYEKAGNNDIFDFAEDFPFIQRDKKILNFHTEKDSLPFPFALNNVEMFKVFEELFNVSSSAVIFKFLKSLETQTGSSLKRAREDVILNNKRIEAIVNLQEAYDIEELEKTKDRADAAMAGMIGLDKDLEVARKNNKISKTIKNFLELSGVEDLEEINKSISKMPKYLEDLKSLRKDITIIVSNNEIENIKVYKKEFDTAVIDDYRALSEDYKLLKSLESSLREYDEDIKSLKEEFQEISEQLAEIEICPLCGNKLDKTKEGEK